MKRLILSLLLIISCSTTWSADFENFLAFAILDNKRDMGVGELLQCAIGAVIVFCLVKWWLFGSKSERPLGKVEEILSSGIIVLLFSFGLSFLIRLIGFVTTGESVSIGGVLLYTVMIFVALVMQITYPSKYSLADDHKKKKITLFWQRLLWWFSIMLGFSLAFVCIALDINVANVSAAILAAMVSSVCIFGVVELVNSATSDYHRLPSDTTDPNYALFKEMSDEISKDPNFDRERWVAKNGSRIYAAKNTRRRE